MRFLVRLLGGIWLATLLVSAGFAYLEVREERERQIDSLKRRATLVGYAVAEASERLVTRGARSGYERVLARFGTPERGLAIYDSFGGVLGATVDVRPYLGPISPLVSDAIRRNEPVAAFQNVGGRPTEVTGLARTLARARTAAEQEARLRLAGESLWTEERLKQFVELRFGGRPVFVVSNREPVSHVRDGRVVREQEPASGLVTALGPIMQACGGVWVAHGSGNADREVGE